MTGDVVAFPDLSPSGGKLVPALASLEAQINGIETAVRALSRTELLAEWTSIAETMPGSPWLLWAPATIVCAIIEAELQRQKTGGAA